MSASKEDVVRDVTTQLGLTPLAAQDGASIHINRCQSLFVHIVSNPNMMGSFYDAFDWQAQGCVDYPTVVRHPQHVNAVQKNILDGAYATFYDFYIDLSLIFCNALLYNPSEHRIHQVASAYLQSIHERLDTMMVCQEGATNSDEVFLKGMRILLALTCKDEHRLFHKPVDVEGYKSEMLHPLSISCIGKRMDKNVYSHWNDFWDDVDTLWSNAESFNDDPWILNYTASMKTFSRNLRTSWQHYLWTPTSVNACITPEMAESWISEFSALDPSHQFPVLEQVKKSSSASHLFGCSAEVMAFSMPPSLFFQTSRLMKLSNV